MLHVATCLWDRNEGTFANSGSYDDGWVERLYGGFRRHLTLPFRFVVITDRPRPLSAGIAQEFFSRRARPDYSFFTEPYRLNQPMILVGLDTIITGSIDHLARWCLEGDRIALCRDPKSVSLKGQGYPDQSINGVALVPAGWRCVYDEWHGENDMQHLRRYPWACIDDKWPGQVVSYKLRIRPDGERLGDARIVYFHGAPKPDALSHIEWVREHWR